MLGFEDPTRRSFNDDRVPLFVWQTVDPVLKFDTQFRISSHLYQGQSPKTFLSNRHNGAYIACEQRATYSLTPADDSVILPPENKKPELGGSGGKSAIGPEVPPIIAESDLPASDKKFAGNGDSMFSSSQGFTKVPKSLRTHPAYRAASIKYRLYFRELLDLVVWKPTDFYIGTHKIILRPGQYCYSQRQMAEELSMDATKDLGIFSHSDIRGCERFFQGVNFLTRSVTHSRTVVTIIYSTFCDENIFFSNTVSNTELTQSSHTKEDILDLKDLKKERSRSTSSPRTARRAVASEDGMRPNKKPAILKKKYGEDGNVELSDEEHAKLLKRVGEEDLKWMIEKLDAYLPNAVKQYKSHYATMKKHGWVHAELIESKSAKSQQAKLEEKPKLASLAPRLGKNYRYEIRFNSIEIFSITGHVAGRFDGADIQGFEKWLTERNL